MPSYFRRPAVLFSRGARDVYRLGNLGMSEILERALRLRGYLQADPGNVELACETVDALFAAARYEEAESLLSSLPQASLAAAGMRFRAARCALVRGRHEAATLVLQSLIEEGYENVALWHDLAFCQLCLRRTADAIDTLDSARLRFGESAELALVRARVALMDGDFAAAHRALDTALALAPQYSTGLGLRALALLDEGRTDEAAQAAKLALEVYPDQHEALIVAGTTSLWLRDLNSAESHFERALQRHPNSGRALSGAGQARMLRTDLEGARGLLERAVVAMPDHIGTWHALAWVHLLAGDPIGAEHDYHRAYELDQNFADSHGGLALIHALRRETEAAEASIKRALRLNPQCPTALYAKTLLLTDAGEARAADRLLGKMLEASALPLDTDVSQFARVLRARLSQSAA